MKTAPNGALPIPGDPLSAGLNAASAALRAITGGTSSAAGGAFSGANPQLAPVNIGAGSARGTQSNAPTNDNRPSAVSQPSTTPQIIANPLTPGFFGSPVPGVPLGFPQPSDFSTARQAGMNVAGFQIGQQELLIGAAALIGVILLRRL